MYSLAGVLVAVFWRIFYKAANAPARVAALIAVLTAIVSVAALPVRARVYAAAPGGDIHNPEILATDIANPAVVRILTTYQAQLRVQLCGQNYGLYATELAVTGSGAFISGNGDIVTADHVVNTPIGDLQAGALAQLGAQVAADLTSKCGHSAAASDIFTMYQQNPLQFAFTFAAPQSTAWFGAAYAGSYPNISPLQIRQMPLTIEAESSYSFNDLAIVRANIQNTPMLTIGASADVAPTDTLMALGFPGNADLAGAINLENANNFLDASINPVFVSAIKTNSDGAPLLQVSGNIEHGDSGGPVINSHGNLVGVVSFAIAVSDPNNVGETRFLQASASIAPLLAAAHVTNTPDLLQTQWARAMNDFAAATTTQQWNTAAAEFNALVKQYPNFGGAQAYAQYAQRQASAAPLSVFYSNGLSDQVFTIILIGLAALAILLLYSTLTVLLLRARRKQKVVKKKFIRRNPETLAEPSLQPQAAPVPPRFANGWKTTPLYLPPTSASVESPSWSRSAAA